MSLSKSIYQDRKITGCETKNPPLGGFFISTWDVSARCSFAPPPMSYASRLALSFFMQQRERETSITGVSSFMDEFFLMKF